MNRLVLGAVALTAAGWTASAQAADLPYSAYTANPPPGGFSWARPYIGGNLGYAWGSVDNNLTRPSGLSGGVQAGYNWQTGSWVFGVEGDIQATGAEDTFAPWKFSNPWFGTVRGRVGYALSNILLYGTGAEFGFASSWSAKIEYLYVDLANDPFTITGRSNGYQFGLVRAGVNYHF